MREELDAFTEERRWRQHPLDVSDELFKALQHDLTTSVIVWFDTEVNLWDYLLHAEFYSPCVGETRQIEIRLEGSGLIFEEWSE